MQEQQITLSSNQLQTMLDLMADQTRIVITSQNFEETLIVLIRGKKLQVTRNGMIFNMHGNFQPQT